MWRSIRDGKFSLQNYLITSREVTLWRSFPHPLKCSQGNIREKSCQWFLIWLGYICDLGAEKLSHTAGFWRQPFDLLVNTAQGGLFLGCSWEFCWARKYKGFKHLNFLLACYKMEESLCNRALTCLSSLDLGGSTLKKKFLASWFFLVSVSFSLFSLITNYHILKCLCFTTPGNYFWSLL